MTDINHSMISDIKEKEREFAKRFNNLPFVRNSQFRYELVSDMTCKMVSILVKYEILTSLKINIQLYLNSSIHRNKTFTMEECEIEVWENRVYVKTADKMYHLHDLDPITLMHINSKLAVILKKLEENAQKQLANAKVTYDDLLDMIKNCEDDKRWQQ